MTEQRIHFIGVLANTDSSILKVKLEKGFKIEAIAEKEGFELFSALERVPPSQFPRFGILGQYFDNLRCIHREEFFFVVRNSFSFTPDPDPHSLAGELRAENEFENNLVSKYLRQKIRLMRLFKEGDIRMPLRYFYVIENNEIRPSTKFFSHSPVSWEEYKLEDSELDKLNMFMNDVTLPFREPNLQLAFENYEVSYNVEDTLAFVTLMMSLETLLNQGTELRYKISRNAAVLLGEDREHAKSIFSEIKDLYNKRSNIVHSGKCDDFSRKDLLKLRHYVRESIKEINRIGKGKDELLKLLNQHGFGERIS